MTEPVSAGSGRARPGRTRARRWVTAGGIAVVVLLVVAAGVVAVVWPSVTATGCPRCYGLVRLADGIFAEDDSREAEVVALVGAARQRVGDFFGAREATPDVLVCFTDDCYARIGGGGERGIAVLNRAIMLSPRGLDVVIAAHEMAHVELHHRLDTDVPQWFDEGLAVVAADDARYLKPPGAPDRCRAEPDGPLPATLPDWLRAATADPQAYAKAACRVSRQLAAAPPTDLINRLNSGVPADTLPG